MVEKGLLRKEKIGLVNFYQPIMHRDKLMKQATEKLVSSAFGGSFGSLAAFLVGSGKLTADDLDTIKQMIDAKENE